MLLDCSVVAKMFTDAQLIMIGGALTGAVVAAVALLSAYCVQEAKKLIGWSE